MMVLSRVYVAILIIVNTNYFIECGIKRQTACLKELNDFLPSTVARNSSSDSERICSTIFGCCNKTIENEMRMHITKKLTNLIRNRNELVRNRFKVVFDDFADLSRDVLKKTGESAIEYMRSNNVAQGSTAQQTAPHVRTLFEELQKSLNKKDLHIKNSTTKFFKNFYPVVHQNYVAKKKLPDDFSKCLKSHLDVINPFENVPHKVTTLFMTRLTPVQMFLRGLQSVGHVLDTIDNVELSQGCAAALVKMRYCSLCDGFDDAKPCLGYCMDVVSMCVEPYLIIEKSWKSFITNMDENVLHVAKSLDASTLFQKLQGLISESMSHATHSNVATKVFKHCGNATNYAENKIVSLKKKPKNTPARDIGNGDLYLTDAPNSHIYLPTEAEISTRLIFLSKNLSNIRNHMGSLHRDICVDSGLAAPETNDDNCWIGTGLGRYNTSGVQNVTELKPSNSKMIIEDVTLLLRAAKNEIRRLQVDNDGSGDGLENGYGSGESGDGEWETNPTKYPYGSGCEGDDEDCFSGSGNDTVDDDKIGTTTKPSSKMLPSKQRDTSPSSGACAVQLSIPLGILLYWQLS